MIANHYSVYVTVYRDMEVRAYACGEYLLDSDVIIKTYDLQWEMFDNVFLPPDSARCLQIKKSSSGIIYVAFISWDGNAYVKKFTGSEWTDIGNPISGIPKHSGAEMIFRVDGETLYVFYNDDNYSERATLRKFNGTDWIVVGKPGIGDDYQYNYSIDDIGLGFLNGIPYITYNASFDGFHCRKLDNNQWVELGKSSLNKLSIRVPVMQFSDSGNLYIFYSDGSNSREDVITYIPGLLCLYL